MGSEAKQNTGAKGRKDVLLLDPDDLVLVTDKKHPLYDPRVELPLDEAMVLNIMVHGVIEPAIGRFNGKHPDGRFVVEVVAGRQRTKAAREANKRLRREGKLPINIPVLMKRGDDADLFGVMISENAIRKDDDALGRAKLIQRYLDMGRSEAQAAVQFGMHVSTVKHAVALLDLAPEVQAAVSAGEIGATFAATEVGKVAREEQPKLLEELRASGATRGVAAREAVQQIRQNGHVARDPSGSVSTKKRRSRGELEAFKKALTKWSLDKSGASARERADAEVALAVVKWVLGGDRALGAFPHLQEALAT